VFLNTLVYMKRFAGQKPLVVGDSRSREWLRAYLGGEELPEYVENQLPEAWLAEVGKDVAKLRATCDKELGFVHRVGKRWQVDADCKALGLDNRQVESLHRCVELLGKEGGDAMHARAVLERYTGERLKTAAQWQQWLTNTRDRLFHSDVVGRFERAPDDLVPPHRAATR
jgi:hypothetical protein